MSISPSAAAQLTSGATLQFTATGLNAEDSAVTGMVPTWSSSEPMVASISATGLLTGALVGTTTITATMSGVSSAGVTVAVVPGPASTSRSLLQANPMVVLADGHSTSTVTATLEDANGNQLQKSAGTVAIASTGGSISATTDNGDGTYAAVLTVPTTTGSAILSATLNGDSLSATDTVTFVTKDTAEQYSVTASTISPVAGAGITLSAQLEDANGNAVALGGRAVSWTVEGETGGTFSAQTSQTSDSGLAVTTYATGTSIGAPYTVQALDAKGALGTVNVTNQAGTAQSVQWTGPSHILVTDSAMSLSHFTSVNQYGRTDPSPTLSFVSRTTAAATVSGSGVVSPVAVGQTMVVGTAASNASASDSVLVAVAASGGPVVRTDLSRFDIKSDTTFTVTLIVDMPDSEALGAITMALTWNPTLLTYVSDAEAGSGVGASVGTANAANGTLLLSAASSSGFTRTVALREVTFKASATAGLTGALHLGVTELTTATTFTDLLPETVALTYPLITR